MIRRFTLFALALHALYAALWLVLDRHAELRFERYAVTAAVTIAFVAYVVLVVAYWKAQKTRLNTALAVNKFYWALLIGALILPGLWGVLLRDAPYNQVVNPYSFWTAPAWLRTYIWVALSISIIWVLVAFWLANWGKAANPSPPDQLIAQRMPAPPRADA